MRSAFQFAIGLILLAVCARGFLVMGLIVPVTVDGSSMAPTINGPCIELMCSQCETRSQIGTDQLLPRADTLCPVCKARLAVEKVPILDGDSLWINRAAFDLRSPRRWEVIVFQCPHDATQLCVKRIVGLPGERIAFRGGELWVDGRHLSKPVDVEYEIRPGDGIRHPNFDARQQCWQLGEGFFVVGDNQQVSLDSRNWLGRPELPARLIVGRPLNAY